MISKLLERLRRGTVIDNEIEQLDRRLFLRGMTVTAGGLLVARPLVFDQNPRRLVYAGGLIIDYGARTIEYAASIDANGHTPKTLYEFLQETFRNDPGVRQLPMVKITHHDPPVRLLAGRSRGPNMSPQKDG